MLYNRNTGFQKYLNDNEVMQGIQEIKYPVNPQFQQNPTQILHSSQTNPQQMNFNNILIPINHLGPSPLTTNQQINFQIPTDKILIPINSSMNFNNGTPLPLQPQLISNNGMPINSQMNFNGGTPLPLQQQLISNNDLSLHQMNFSLSADKVSSSLPQEVNKKSFTNQRHAYRKKLLKVTPPIKVTSDFNEIFQFGKRLIFEFKTGEMYVGELYNICHYFQKLELINCFMLRAENDDKINLMKNLRTKPIPFFIMEIHHIHHRIPGLNFDDFYFDDDKSNIKVLLKDSPSSSNVSNSTKDDLKWIDLIEEAEVKSIKSTAQLNVNAAEFKPGGSLLQINNDPSKIEKSDSIISLKEVDLKPLITECISSTSIEKIEKALKSINKVSKWTSKEDFGIAIDNISSEVEIATNFEFQQPQHTIPHTLQIYAPKINKIFIFDKKSTESRCIKNIFENSKIRKIIHFNDQIKRSLKNELKFNLTNFLDTHVMFTKLYPPTEEEKATKNVRKNVTLLEMIEIVLNVKNDYIEFTNEVHLLNLNIKKKLIIGKLVVFLYEIYERLFHEQCYRILFTSKFTVIENTKINKNEAPNNTMDTNGNIKKLDKNKNPSNFEYNFKGNFNLDNNMLGAARNEFQINYKMPTFLLKKP